MFLKCYHHLHPAVGLESEFVEQTMDVNCSFDIFGMVEIISEKNCEKKTFNFEMLSSDC
jgi:hypothetical protein